MLTVTRGPDQGKQIRLRDGESYTLGAGSGSSLVLTDPKVLDPHCVIQVTDGQPILLNKTASAGTFVGTKRIAKARLAPGSTFRIGDTLLALRAAPKPRVAEEPDPLLGKIVGGYRIN